MNTLHVNVHYLPLPIYYQPRERRREGSPSSPLVVQPIKPLQVMSRRQGLPQANKDSSREGDTARNTQKKSQRHWQQRKACRQR